MLYPCDSCGTFADSIVRSVDRDVVPELGTVVGPWSGRVDVPTTAPPSAFRGSGRIAIVDDQLWTTAALDALIDPVRGGGWDRGGCDGAVLVGAYDPPVENERQRIRG